MASPINRIYFGGLTSSLIRPAGSNVQRTVLIINQDGLDVLHEVSDSLWESSNATAFLVENITSKNIVPELLTNSSIRIAFKGVGAWRPSNYFVWAERDTHAPQLYPPEIIPLAFENDITKTISADFQYPDSFTSMPVRLLQKGSNSMPINRLFFIVLTRGWPVDDTGTDSPITLQISNAAGNLVVSQTIPDTPQNDFEDGIFCSYFIPQIQKSSTIQAW